MKLIFSKTNLNFLIMKPTVLDLFSGCGGFSHGFIQAGYEVIGFVEMWTPAIETYKLNHPNAKHLGFDITKIKDSELFEYKDKIDVIIGGPPCQGFSLCGKRNVNDKRNVLYKEYLRFVRIINPKTIVMENVKGLLSMRTSDNEKVINKIVNDLIELGYSVCYKILNASDYGVAQNRERLIIIGKKLDLFPASFNEKISVLEAISNISSEANGNVNFNLSENTLERIKILKEDERLNPKFNTSRRRIHGNSSSPTVMTKPLFIHPTENRLLTTRELARLQSFPDDFIFTGSKTSMVKQIGNAVAPKMAKEIAIHLDFQNYDTYC